MKRQRKSQEGAPSLAREDGDPNSVAEMLCSTCAYATPVTDRFLSSGRHEPTLAHCEFRKYLVLWRGKCEERNIFTMKHKYKRKK